MANNKSDDLYRFSIDPTVPGDHGQSDPLVQAALAEEARRILAETQKIHVTRTEMMTNEHHLHGDVIEAGRHTSQYHTASGRTLDFRGRPLNAEQLDDHVGQQVSGQYHTSAGHPLDVTGQPVAFDPDLHYDNQVRQVGVAHQEALPNQTMLHQYHTSSGDQLNEFGLPFEPVVPDAKKPDVKPVPKPEATTETGKPTIEGEKK